MSQGKLFTPEEQNEIIERTLENLRKGMPEYAAAETAGASYPTWFRWREALPGLDARIAEAKRGRIVMYEDALHKAALKGSVTACLTLLRKHSKEWRELIDGSVAPANPAMEMLAGVGVAAMVAMLPEEKRVKLKQAMYREGLLALPPGSMNGNGSNGQGPGH